MSMNEALAAQQEEPKKIMIDVYTTWCGPCKWMAKNTFTDKAVGEYFNANFVNAKFDMEKGEGPELAQLYQVRAYPTLLFISAAGELVHRKMKNPSCRTTRIPHMKLSRMCQPKNATQVHL